MHINVMNVYLLMSSTAKSYNFPNCLKHGSKPKKKKQKKNKTNFSSCNSTIITVGQKNISKHIVLQQKWSQTVNYNKNNKV